jgi:GNAT superfamily N-acetyltransferase
MTDFHYQVVKELPVDTVVELYTAGGWWTEDPKGRAIIPRMVAGSYCFMVAKDGERVVGMGRAISDGHSDAYIQDVVVLKEYRGKGIGAQLVKRLAEHCTAQGLLWVGLVAEPGTTPFYEALGFKPLKNYQPMLYQKQA